MAMPEQKTWTLPQRLQHLQVPPSASGLVDEAMHTLNGIVDECNDIDDNAPQHELIQVLDRIRKMATEGIKG